MALKQVNFRKIAVFKSIFSSTQALEGVFEL
jgi:hypothetical protein